MAKTDATISLQELNRATLARQLLMERAAMTPVAAVEQLIGMQAQEARPSFIGLWSRLRDGRRDQMIRAINERELVRATLMRGTIHLVTPPDALRIAPHIQPELEKAPFRQGFNYGAMVGLDPDEVRAHGEAALGDEPKSAADLRAEAARRYPDRDAGAVLQTWLYQLPVLQTPPRGRWGDNSRPVWSRVQPWLGAPLDPTYPVSELILRYLRAFGPASTMDMQAWSRLPAMKKAVAELGDRVRTYTDARGRTLYDAADLELADPDLPAPVRLLGWYDNALLSHQDRARITGDDNPPTLRAFATNVSPILIDGFAAGVYKIFVKSGTARLRISPARPWTKTEAAQVEAEAGALLTFLESESEPVVEILEPGADLRL